MKEVARKIQNAGGKLYLVGGAVRDRILGLNSKDDDYCVTGISAHEFQDIFPEAKLRGKNFPVFDFKGSEFALARVERKTGKGHKSFDIESDKNLKIEDDLIRRDITINSMAYDILEEKIIDPFNGIDDCKNKIIRATSNAFIEDPLRVYRVARFASQLEFNVENNTLILMKKLSKELSSLSVERVYEELKKALSTAKPSLFFTTLKNADCLSTHFSKIEDLIGVDQPIEYHPEGDAFTHTMEVLDRCAIKTDDVVIRFSALVHDLEKAKTPKENLPHHYGHEELGIECVKEMCNELKLPIIWKKAGITSSKEHMKAGRFNEMRASTKVDFIERVSRTTLGLNGLEIIANCDKIRENDIEFAGLGEKMLKEVNAKTLRIENCDYKFIKEKVRSERIKWIKANNLWTI